MQQNLIDLNDRIAKHYGLHRQQEQLLEETAELTQAIIKKRRFENGTLYKLASSISLDRDICEEIADVMIVLAQLIHLMGARKEVEDWMEYKVNREWQRITGKSEQ